MTRSVEVTAMALVSGLAAACASPPPQVINATPAQVMIQGSAVTGAVNLGQATAAAQEQCQRHGRDARYTRMIDTGTIMWGPIPTRVFDCVDPPPRR